MLHVRYKGADFELSDQQDRPSFFVLGVRKSGSTILNRMLRTLSQHQGLAFLDVAGKLFEAGVRVRDWQRDPGLACLLGGGNVYGGFRTCPIALLDEPLFIACRKVLLVRDPRDALVSEYFSNAFSHSVPQGTDTRAQMLQLRREALASPIDDFVVSRAPGMACTMLEYAPLLRDPLLKLYRYESIIADKRRMLEEIAAHFAWSVDEARLKGILAWADVFPQEERPTEFVRRVRPGDHRDKVSAPAIGQLNELLAEPMRVFGYAA